MVYAAFGVLHLEEPVEFVLNFVKNVRDIVAGFRDAESIVKCLRIEAVSEHEVSCSLSAGYYVSSVVACIVPAA